MVTPLEEIIQKVTAEIENVRSLREDDQYLGAQTLADLAEELVEMVDVKL